MKKETKLHLTPTRLNDEVRAYRIIRLVNRESISDRAGKEFRVGDFIPAATVKWLCEDKNLDVTIAHRD